MTLNKNVWNCQDIYVDSLTTIEFTGSSNVELRAQGNVVIDGTIDVSASGVNPGPGGGDPGLNSAQDGFGYPTGGGQGGANASFGFQSGTGGGGAGSGVDGASVAGGGNGGFAFNLETSFETTVIGGRGGGAGGYGDDGAVQLAGGTGGAGGGAIIIVAKGDVNISATAVLDASGADGSFGPDSAGVEAGAGGGGSGGAVYIVSSTSLTFNGTVNAQGGGGGASNLGTADGGAGGYGRIRFDAPDGSRSVGGGISPGTLTPTENTPPNIIDPLSRAVADLKSDIEYACSYKEELPYEPQVAVFCFGFLFILGLARLRRIL